ncbi:hypothetical protein BOX37_14225 [Nocardia mangyaensis]|uniref:Uncharacterized protein n=1 Tax=Nocardia mangyaensis TaxID=2213200 RepID=A0A1J0VS94_9NOCA|nr:hypothetical protein [Nocardia mangyaensis]APE34912.1 hypothetical protein BOX37_14225 [Nocardia mangyaensis]
MTTLTRRGWKLATPMWFPLLCVAVTVLASVPVGVLLDSGIGIGWYWLVASPLSAIVSGWYFTRRPTQMPDLRGLAVLFTGMGLLIAVGLIAWLYRGAWSLVAPWLVVGIGLAALAVGMRSLATAVVGGTAIASALVVAIVDPAHGYSWLALIIGLVAAVAAATEMLRIEPGTGHG